MKKGVAGRLASGSFWLIMFIHIAVFTSIGLFTMRGWRLLIIFVCGLAAMLLVGGLVTWYSRRHPEKKKLRQALIWLNIIKRDAGSRADNDYAERNP